LKVWQSCNATLPPQLTPNRGHHKRSKEPQSTHGSLFGSLGTVHNGLSQTTFQEGQQIEDLFPSEPIEQARWHGRNVREAASGDVGFLDLHRGVASRAAG